MGEILAFVCAPDYRYNDKMTALIYAMVALGNAILTGVMSGWLIYFYLPPGKDALVPLVWFGIAVLLSRIGHIITVTLMNRLPVRAATPQRLYLTAGGILMPLFFVLLWWPPFPGESIWNLGGLFLALAALNIAAGVHQTAYETLLATVEEKERDAVSNWRLGFMLAGNLLSALAGSLIVAWGYAQTMGIFAALSAPFLILPGLLLPRLERETRPAERIPFLEAVASAWSDPAFRVFVVSWGLMWLATTFTFETLPYIVTEICRLSKADVVWFCFASLAASLVGYPVATKLAGRYGVKSVYRAGLLASAVVIPALALVGQGIPLPLFVQGLIWAVLQAICLAGAQALPGAVVAEITANDPARQAQLYAFGNLVDHLASGLALALIPFFLMSGRSLSAPFGPLGVRLLAVAAGVILLGSFWVFGHYKINRSRRPN